MTGSYFIVTFLIAAMGYRFIVMANFEDKNAKQKWSEKSVQLSTLRNVNILIATWPYDKMIKHNQKVECKVHIEPSDRLDIML